MALFGAAVLLCLLLLVVLTPVIYPMIRSSSPDPPCSRRAGAFCSHRHARPRRRGGNRLRRAHLAHHRVGATLAAIVFGAVAGGVAGYYRGGPKPC